LSHPHTSLYRHIRPHSILQDRHNLDKHPPARCLCSTIREHDEAEDGLLWTSGTQDHFNHLLPTTHRLKNFFFFEITQTYTLQKIISRSTPKESKIQSPDNFADDEPLNPVFVNRPPPLDPKVEEELRRSCAIILQDLKPSGYDVEDTRMKSDVLLDEADKDEGRYPMNSSRLHSNAQPQPSAAWIMDSSEKGTNFVNPNNVVKTSNATRLAQAKATSQGAHIDRSTVNSSHLTSMVFSDYDPQSPYPPPANGIPLAPVSTAVNESRQELASPNSVTNHERQYRVTEQIDSSYTVSPTDYSASTDPRSVSTAPSSVFVTPTTGSTRVSDQVHTETSPQQNGVEGAGAWMKEEVERRRQVEEVRILASTTTAVKAEQAEAKQTTTLLGWPGIQNALSERARGREATHLAPTPTRTVTDLHNYEIQGTSPEEDGARTTTSQGRSSGMHRQTNINHQQRSMRRDTTPGSPISATNEATTINAEAPQEQSFSANVPIPQRDAYRAEQMAKERAAVSSLFFPNTDASEIERMHQQRLEEDTASRRVVEEKLTNIKDKSEEPLQTARARIAASESRPGSMASDLPLGAGERMRAEAGAWNTRRNPTAALTAEAAPAPAPARHATGQWPIRPHTAGDENVPPLKHQQDETIFIKDFWSPSAWSPRSAGRLPVAAQANGPTLRNLQNSVPRSDGPDFDDLISVMKENKDSGAVNAIKSARRASGLMDSSKPIDSQSRAAGTASINGNGVAPSGPPTTDDVTHPKTSQTPNAQLTNGDSQTDIASSDQNQSEGGVTSPSRNSTAGYSQTSESQPGVKKPPRGIKKLLARLGGGEMPVRRKIYIAPPRTNASQPEEGGEAEDWSDEEACAAPVVGFGRGW